VTGHDGDWVGLLVWLNEPAAGQLAGLPDADADALAVAEPVRAHLRERLRTYNETAEGSSSRIARLLILTEPPSIDGGEITDKGYINQRTVLTRRSLQVARLYATEPDDDVIMIV
jgi:feruloyl-CoA synthase